MSAMKIFMIDLLRDYKFNRQFNLYFSTIQSQIKFLISSYDVDMQQMRQFFKLLKLYNTRFSQIYIEFFKRQTLGEFLNGLLKIKILPHQHFDNRILTYLEDVVGIELRESFDLICNQYLEIFWNNIDRNIDRIEQLMWRYKYMDCTTIEEAIQLIDYDIETLHIF